jgi:amino acid transporter
VARLRVLTSARYPLSASAGYPLNTPSDVLAGAKACCDITGAIAATAQGRNGAIFFLFLIFIGTMFTVTLSFVAGCRFIYSFARDRGFPGSLNNVMAYVEPRTKVPLGSISLYLALGIAFVCCWTNESPTVAFAAVTGINANGFLMVYGLSPLLRLTTGAKNFVATKEFSLGIFSKPIAALGAAYGAFCNATIALPFWFPQNKNTVNYAPVALAAVCTFAFVLFPLASMPSLGWCYKGPALRESRPGEASVRAGSKESEDPDALAKEVREESVRMGVLSPAAAPELAS